MGRACSPHGKEDLDVDWRIILKCIMGLREIVWVGVRVVDWLYMAQNRDQWHALVNMVMKLWVP
jgi:hypothetical protein